MFSQRPPINTTYCFPVRRKTIRRQQSVKMQHYTGHSDHLRHPLLHPPLPPPSSTQNWTTGTPSFSTSTPPTIQRLQLIQNSLARAVTRTPRHHHKTPILRSLH